jgi:tRNA (cytidine/uridine-2'-O-)-methyltransferase
MGGWKLPSQPIAAMPRVVLFQPQIPPNTGNIARTCAATQTPLHLIAPLGFEISDRYLKRAGLDYWPYVDLTLHESWNAFCKYHDPVGGRWLAFTRQGSENYLNCAFAETDWLIFGRETSGLPAEVEAQCDHRLQIPMAQPGVRSLNLSVSVAVGLFEAQRQLAVSPVV